MLKRGLIRSKAILMMYLIILLSVSTSFVLAGEPEDSIKVLKSTAERTPRSEIFAESIKYHKESQEIEFKLKSSDLGPVTYKIKGKITGYRDSVLIFETKDNQLSIKNHEAIEINNGEGKVEMNTIFNPGFLQNFDINLKDGNIYFKDSYANRNRDEHKFEGRGRITYGQDGSDIIVTSEKGIKQVINYFYESEYYDYWDGTREENDGCFNCSKTIERKEKRIEGEINGEAIVFKQINTISKIILKNGAEFSFQDMAFKSPDDGILFLKSASMPESSDSLVKGAGNLGLVGIINDTIFASGRYNLKINTDSENYTNIKSQNGNMSLTKGKLNFAQFRGTISKNEEVLLTIDNNGITSRKKAFRSIQDFLAEESLEINGYILISSDVGFTIQKKSAGEKVAEHPHISGELREEPELDESASRESDACMGMECEGNEVKVEPLKDYNNDGYPDTPTEPSMGDVEERIKELSKQTKEAFKAGRTKQAEEELSKEPRDIKALLDSAEKETDPAGKGRLAKQAKSRLTQAHTTYNSQLEKIDQEYEEALKLPPEKAKEKLEDLRKRTNSLIESCKSNALICGTIAILAVFLLYKITKSIREKYGAEAYIKKPSKLLKPTFSS